MYDTLLATVPLKIGVLRRPMCTLIRIGLFPWVSSAYIGMHRNGIKLSADSSGYGQVIPV